MRRLEFWPDYGRALLHEDGAAVDIEGLGLPADLVAAAVDWAGRYDDARLEPDTRDEAWIGEGRALFGRLRMTLAAGDIELVDWEGHWSGADGDAAAGALP